jgi:hypothetical protein
MKVVALVRYESSSDSQKLCSHGSFENEFTPQSCFIHFILNLNFLLLASVVVAKTAAII